MCSKLVQFCEPMPYYTFLTTYLTSGMTNRLSLFSKTEKIELDCSVPPFVKSGEHSGAFLTSEDVTMSHFFGAKRPRRSHSTSIDTEIGLITVFIPSSRRFLEASSPDTAPTIAVALILISISFLGFSLCFMGFDQTTKWNRFVVA